MVVMASDQIPIYYNQTVEKDQVPVVPLDASYVAISLFGLYDFYLGWKHLFQTEHPIFNFQRCPRVPCKAQN